MPGRQTTRARHFRAGVASRFGRCFSTGLNTVEKTVEKLFWQSGNFIEQNLNFTVVFDHPINFHEQMIFSEPLWNGKLFGFNEGNITIIN